MDEPSGALARAGIVAVAAFAALVVFALIYGPVSWGLSALGASDPIASIFGLVIGFVFGRAVFRWMSNPDSLLWRSRG